MAYVKLNKRHNIMLIRAIQAYKYNVLKNKNSTAGSHPELIQTYNEILTVISDCENALETCNINNIGIIFNENGKKE